MNEKYDILLKELDLIDSSIRQMDELTKGVKEWSIATWTASIGFALAISQLTPYVALTAAIPAMFWLVDASYRRIQSQFIKRHKQIQIFINSEDFELFLKKEVRFDIMKMRCKDNSALEFFSVMSYFSVCFLYLGQIALSFMLWWLV